MAEALARLSVPKIRLDRIWPLLPALVAWHLLSTTAGYSGNLPSPSGVVTAGARLIDSGLLFQAVALSLGRVFTAFAIVLVAGSVIGVAMGASLSAARWLGPLLETMRPIAPIAWIPMAILWFGATDLAAVSIVAYSGFWPMLLATAYGVRHIDRNLVRAAQNLGAGRLVLFREVLVPGALPAMLVGVRLAMGFEWVAIVAAELTLAAKVRATDIQATGIGQMMWHYADQSLNLNNVVSLMVVVGFVGTLIDAGLRRLSRVLTPWSQEASSRAAP